VTTGKTLVTVVAGGRRSGKSHLIAQLRAGRPAGERWGWLSNSVAPDAADARSRRPTPDLPGAAHGEAASAGELFLVAGGCACCLAGPAFRTTLVRLLRSGPWQRLHIEVDAAGHAPVLVDQLRGPPFDQYLEVTQLLLTLNGTEPLTGQSAGDSLLPESRLGFATDILLRSSPAAAPSYAALLESAPPWPRLERIDGRRSFRAASGLAPALDGWRIYSALLPADASRSVDILRHWPARTTALRRPFKDLLSSLAADPGIAGFQALMRTERAWYRWAYGRGSGNGALAFDEGSTLVEAETAWRFDNRICIWLGSGARRTVVEARVRGLDLALRDGEGLLDSAGA
jgi:hypothetical protein